MKNKELVISLPKEQIIFSDSLLFDFLNDSNIANELQIYPNMLKVVNDLFFSMYNQNQNYNLLFALTQSGKTSVFLLLSFLEIYWQSRQHLLKNKTSLLNMKKSVMLVLHDSNKQVLNQTISASEKIYRGLLKYLKLYNQKDIVLCDPQFHYVLSSNLKILHRSSGTLNNIKSFNFVSLLISDEAHVARNAESKLMNKFKNALKFNRFKYVAVSATPYEDLKLNKNISENQIHILKPDSNYVSLSKLYEANRLHNSFNVFAYCNKKFIISNEFWNILKTKQIQNPQSYAIIRLKDFSQIYKFLSVFNNFYRDHFDVYDVSVKLLIADSSKAKYLKKINPFLISYEENINTDFLNFKPNNFTIVIVAGAYRLGSRLNKQHIGLLFEKGSDQEDTLLQSFLGRATGYYDLHSTNITVYSNITKLNLFMEIEKAVFSGNKTHLLELIKSNIEQTTNTITKTTKNVAKAVISAITIPYDKYKFLFEGNGDYNNRIFTHLQKIKMLFKEQLDLDINPILSKKLILVRNADRKSDQRIIHTHVLNFKNKIFINNFPDLSTKTKNGEVFMNPNSLSVVYSQEQNVIALIYWHSFEKIPNFNLIRIKSNGITVIDPMIQQGFSDIYGEVLST